MTGARCTVKIFGWYASWPTSFHVTCNICKRSLGTFSKHESAMAWAQAHATSSKHIRGEGK